MNEHAILTAAWHTSLCMPVLDIIDYLGGKKAQVKSISDKTGISTGIKRWLTTLLIRLQNLPIQEILLLNISIGRVKKKKII